ncbi:MAG: hypothetical protein EOO11_00115 [Chitinophagaceae bacterium]|nr:MAG: hypothetical protein EOO11_00115 [Chitinophagaceae bacterium]
MKPVLTLFLALCALLQVRAADPVTASSNVQFPVSGIDGGQFTVSFTAGSGNGRIVVVKSGSDISGVPADGVTYTASASPSNAPFGVPGNEFTGSGEYVVFRGSASSVTVTGLTPGTLYYVAIFEYNTGGTPSPDYLMTTPQNRSVTTLSAPTQKAGMTGFSNITGNSLRCNFTAGNGGGRILVGRKGAAITALPANFKSYNYSGSFGSNVSTTYVLDGETFVVFKTTAGSPGQALSADITNLEPNTQYSFAVFEYNGSNAPVYLMDRPVLSVTTAAGPSQAPGAPTFDVVDGNRLSCYWSRGNGSQTIVVMKKGSEVTGVPVNGQNYTASTVFGTPSAEWIGGSGEYVVSVGTSITVAVTNLEKSSIYHYAIFSFDATTGGTTYYYGTPAKKSQSTAVAPTVSRTLLLGTVTGSSAQLSFGNQVAGNGAYRLMAIREDAPITWTPDDLSKYGGATGVFKSGVEVTPGTWTLYGQSNGGIPTISNLSPGHTYYVSSWEMNGPNAPVYLLPGSTISFTVPNEPATASHTPSFPTIEGNRLRFDWTVGNGAQRLVIARKGSAVATLPTDASIYTAAAAFGSGTEMGNGLGEYVVYNGSGNSVTVTGLEPGTTYHFAVVEYNSTTGGPDYLTAATKWLATSKATYSAPTGQVTNLGTSAVGSTQATVTFNVGNGTSRIIVAKAGGAVDVSPADLQAYSGSTAFGSGAHLGGGNYVVAVGFNGSFTLSGLQAGTTYHLAAFECNGSTGPVYLRPAVTHNFTTTGGTVAPTQEASAPLFESVDGNRFTFRWTAGNGASRIVVARKSAAVSFAPVNGNSYAHNTAFGSGSNLGDDQYVVYSGTGTQVTISNLEPATTYQFRVFELNGSGAATAYLTTAPLAASGSTATAPSARSTNPLATPAATSLALSWANGNGSGRIVVLKAGSAPAAAPADLVKYIPNAEFGNGPQLGTGEYVVYSGIGNGVTVTGLTPGSPYFFKVYEFNGTDAPVYNSADALEGSASTQGALPLSWLYVRSRQTGSSVRIEWATAQESNTDRFVVERSIESSPFEAIGQVAAAGNSAGTRSYSFTDATPPAGRLQYRIRQVDRDNRFSYSAIVTARGGGSADVRLLQNPVQTQLPVQSSGAATLVRYRIVDGSGRSCAEGSLAPGRSSLPVGGLARGTYFLAVYTAEGAPARSIPFVKN